MREKEKRDLRNDDHRSLGLRYWRRRSRFT